jgi:pimeloyl-ACP methyl ester carboxylesterase
MSVWYDVHGEGPPVALVHAGVADSRMWEPQLRSFAAAHKVVRVDLPGFGRSPIESNPISWRGSILEALDAAGIDRAAIVGTSIGGTAALELALDSPERVSALVLVGPGLDGHEWSAEVEAFGAEEEEALARGDLDGAVDANMRAWLAGPRRSIEDLEPALREQFADMQRQAFELQRGHDDVHMVRLHPPASQRLGDVVAPTLVLAGDEDFDDIHRIAERLAAGIPGATRATIPGAAHLPNLEQPEEFDRIVLGFLARHET